MHCTSLCAIGAQIITLGKANNHATHHADIQLLMKCGIGPTALNVLIPEIRKDIIPDKIKGNNSLDACIL